MPNLISVKRQDLLSYSQDAGNELTATEYYLVTWDSPVPPIVAEQSDGVPVYAQAHPDDPTRLLKQKRPQCVENSNRMHWQVQCDYSSLVDSQPNPLLRPSKISWSSSDGTQPYQFDHASLYQGITDCAGNAVTTDQFVVNTAYELFPTAAEREVSAWEATFVKNMAATFTVASEVKNQQAINTAAFTFDGVSIAQYAAKISGGSLSAVETENGYQYRVLTYKLKFKDGGWIDTIESRGFNQLQTPSGGGTPKPVPIVVTSLVPQPTNIPYPLDCQGHLATPIDATHGGAKMKFYPYIPVDFVALGLSQSTQIIGIQGTGGGQ